MYWFSPVPKSFGFLAMLNILKLQYKQKLFCALQWKALVTGALEKGHCRGGVSPPEGDPLESKCPECPSDKIHLFSGSYSEAGPSPFPWDSRLHKITPQTITRQSCQWISAPIQHTYQQ